MRIDENPPQKNQISSSLFFIFLIIKSVCSLVLKIQSPLNKMTGNLSFSFFNKHKVKLIFQRHHFEVSC